jgi:hypothetical protein
MALKYLSVRLIIEAALYDYSKCLSLCEFLLICTADLADSLSDKFAFVAK